MKLTRAYRQRRFFRGNRSEVKGRVYRVKVTPKTTETPSYAQIELKAESSSFPRPEACRVNANVQ